MSEHEQEEEQEEQDVIDVEDTVTDDIAYNVWFRRLRLALQLSDEDIAAVYTFTHGPLITKLTVNRWAVPSSQKKAAAMTRLDFDRLMEGLPSFMSRRSFMEERALQERKKAEALSARRRAASEKRRATIARNKAAAGA